EESEDDSARLQAERVFIVDPIDGTRSYLEGRSAWAVSLAVAHGGEVETAVIAMPAKRQVFAAVAGGGATRDDRTIHASRREAIDSALVLAPRVALAPETGGPGGAPPVARHFRPSLAYR